MSPPFIISIAMSPTGILAAGTADGQLWVGFGGEKVSGPQRSTGPKPKKSKKWDGLKEAQEVVIKAAEGPVVALAFANASTLLVSTLHGRVLCYNVERRESPRLVEKWCRLTKSISKVNVLASHERHLFLGGIGNRGKGCLEVCNHHLS